MTNLKVTFSQNKETGVYLVHVFHYNKELTWIISLDMIHKYTILKHTKYLFVIFYEKDSLKLRREVIDKHKNLSNLLLSNKN